jgi:glycine cleavage system regulatory protein
MHVLTVIGADRTGLVEALAREIAAVGGNWEESRLVRLAGQFAGVLLVTIDTARTDELVNGVRKLGATGLQVSVHPTKSAAPPAESVRFRLDVTANDRPGIIRDVSQVLAERGLNVEELESEVASAPMSGDRMFAARLVVRAASRAQLDDVRKGLESLGGELMVDVADA